MRIESLDHYGRGITRIDNKIIFVENALPGEDVEISIIKQKKKFNEAVTTRINKKASNRVDVKCPYYSICGGCNIMHMSYEEQLHFKQNKISNIIERYIGKSIKINNIVYDKQFGYRNKLTLHTNRQVGLYNKKTNDIVKIDKCLICSDLINKGIKSLSNLDSRLIKEIIIRQSDNENLIEIIGSKDINIKDIEQYFDNIIIKDDENYLKKGKDYLIKEIGGIKYQISIESFFQVNYGVMKKMYDYIKSKVKNNNNVLDLYCGTGSIALYIANTINQVKGIEINKQAIIDADKNRLLNNIDNAQFVCSDTNNIVIDNSYDTIIVDPPRSGLNQSIMKEIIKSKSNNIIYVSCNPMTLVRDLNKLIDYYHIEEIVPFDMFPNTYHVECVCILKNR